MTPSRFMEYFRTNYPGPRTVISKPDWHAPKIYSAALAFSGYIGLLEAAKFALSVLKENPVELSERLAIERLEVAIKDAEAEK